MKIPDSNALVIHKNALEYYHEDWFVGLARSETGKRKNDFQLFEPRDYPFRRTGYARQPVPKKRTESVVYFPKALSDWGYLDYFIIFDQERGGHLIAYGKLAASAWVFCKNQATFKISDLLSDFLEKLYFDRK